MCRVLIEKKNNEKNKNNNNKRQQKLKEKQQGVEPQAIIKCRWYEYHQGELKRQNKFDVNKYDSDKISG